MSVMKAIVNKLFKDEQGNWSKAKMLNVGATGYFSASTYSDSRAEGNGVATSLVSAAGDAALSAMLNPWAYLGLTAAPALAEAAIDGYHAMDSYGRQLQAQRRNVPFQNATFVDSQQTYTMRQAGMNLARQGQMAAQQTSMGNEASALARY